MAEFIGARISLVSRSDIRYVGTLHEINSETSTVALENVTSFGTEGRKGNPEEEIPSSDNVYDYIVFRGSDVKDLRIEEAPVAKENKPPQVPNDPAILGSGTRPPPQTQKSNPSQNQASQRQNQPGPPQQQGPVPPGPPFGQHPQYPPFYPPPPAGWGRGGPQGPGGFPAMPYGVPPGWYPPPGQGFPQPPPFSPYGYPPGPPGQFPPGPPGQQGQGPKPAPIGAGAKQQNQPPQAEKQNEAKPSGKPAEMAAPSDQGQKVPTPPIASKSSSTEAQSGANQSSNAQNAPAAGSKPAPTGPKSSRVQPAIPLKSPAATPLQTNSGNTAPANAQSSTAASIRDATQAATAAVAAAMAKLPHAGQTNGSAVDNLTKKVNEMRTSDPIRGPRQPGSGGAGFQNRGGSRGGRGGAKSNPAQKVELPATDFDFESSNAKFNKQDLVKEAIAGSPLGEQPSAISPEVEVPVTGYNKTTSFFDNISSESRDRAEAANGTGKPGGREWRGEEQKKNVETFGQGSVDNGYRGGFRGRGRGRGRGFRGRGYSGPGRGGYRGERGDAQTAGQ